MDAFNAFPEFSLFDIEFSLFSLDESNLLHRVSLIPLEIRVLQLGRRAHDQLHRAIIPVRWCSLHTTDLFLRTFNRSHQLRRLPPPFQGLLNAVNYDSLLLISEYRASLRVHTDVSLQFEHAMDLSSHVLVLVVGLLRHEVVLDAVKFF